MAVMNTKRTVNTTGVSTGPVASVSSSEPMNLSAQDLKKLAGESVGEVLNKVSDPNWVDPSKKPRSVGNANLDKDAFFKLMMAQLKNQDPTNPLQSHEMAAQLANFSSLEQMQNMNATLTDMKNAQKPQENYQILNLIGKAVAGDSSQVIRTKGDRDHDLRYDLPGEAAEVNVKVRNADGAIIRNYTMKNLKQGENQMTWNGQDDKGNIAPVGEYQFIIEAKNSNGTKMSAKTSFEGRITGVNYSNEGPLLLVGKQTIRMRDVKKIIDPSLMSNDQKLDATNNLDLKKNDASSDTQSIGNTESQGANTVAPEAKPKIMDNVGLSRQMMDKLAKETKQ